MRRRREGGHAVESLVLELLPNHGAAVGDGLLPEPATAKRLELPMERVILTVREHGNTSAASVPMALDTAIRDGRVKRGDLLLLEAFGGGFTWGASLIRY